MFVGHLCIFFGEMFVQFLLPLGQSAQAAITKQTAWLKPQNLFSSNAGAWKFDIKVPSWSILFFSWLIGSLHIGVCLSTSYQIHIVQIFSAVRQVVCSILSFVSLCSSCFTLCLLLHRGFKVNVVSFVYFYFVTTCALGIRSKASFLIQCHEASPLFSSKSLIKSCIQVFNPF